MTDPRNITDLLFSDDLEIWEEREKRSEALDTEDIPDENEYD